jgi:hypothetical protein
MPKKSEAHIMAEAIISQHDGQAYYNFSEVGKIIGCGRNTVALVLDKAGILVKKVGPSKRVSAYDIASLMCLQRTVPYGD